MLRQVKREAAARLFAPWILVSVTAAFFWSGCEESGPPRIVSIEGPVELRVLDSTEFLCRATGQGPLFYSWSGTGGRFAWTSGYRVKWYAPESSGAETLFVTVNDSLGRSVGDTLMVKVNRLTLVLVGDDGGLKPRAYVWYQDTVRQGYVLKGTTWADTGVMFLYLDSVNFVRWRSREPCEFVVRRPAYDTRNFSDTILEAGVYFAVMDNSGTDTERAYRLYLTATSP